jgi:iron complex outermembrane receptor protein
MRHSFEILRKYALALLCGALVFASIDVSATEESFSEQAYLQDLPVVLSASRLSQPLSEAPNAMTVIDRQMIKASGFRTIADLFRLVPGMYVGYAGANTPIVSLNGISDQYSRRMQVLIDGRSVYLPPFGGIDWQDLPLLINDIERIEVVRGPAAASHGSNSFYGVINIITRDAGSLKAQTISVSKGEMGVSDVSAYLGKDGEDIDYRLSFGYRTDGGNNPQVVNDTSSNHILNLRSNYRLNGDNSVDMQLGSNNGSYGHGTAGRPLSEPFVDGRTNSDFLQLNWLHTWEGADETKLTYYQINHTYTDPRKCILNCYVPLGPATYTLDEAKIKRDEFEIQNTTHLGASHRAVWGGGLRSDTASQPLIFSTSVTSRQSRIFAHDEWRMTESALINAGAMHEDDGAGHRNTSPRLSFNYHLLPKHTLRASISSATRNPMMAERNLMSSFNGYWRIGNTPSTQDVRPERMLAKEIGYIGQFGAVALDSRIYYDRVSDVILTDFGADLAHLANSFKNMGEATYKGLDVSASYKWEEGKVTANYSRQKASCAFSAFPTQYFSSIPVPGTTTTFAQLYQTDYLSICGESVPANSGSLLLSQNLSETIHFSVGYYLRSKVRVSDSGSDSPATHYYPAESQMRRVDMRIAKAFGQKEKAGGGEMALVLQNAFQDNYTGYGDVSQRVNLLFKRRTYLTATIYF